MCQKKEPKESGFQRKERVGGKKLLTLSIRIFALL